jgi:hypothetical protein
VSQRAYRRAKDSVQGWSLRVPGQTQDMETVVGLQLVKSWHGTKEIPGGRQETVFSACFYKQQDKPE